MFFYLALFITLFAIWGIALCVSDGALVAPVPLALLGVSVSVSLAAVGWSSWNHVELQWESAMVVVVGSVSLLLGLLIAHCIIGAPRNRKCVVSNANFDYLAPYWKYLVVGFVLIVAIALRVAETYRIAEDLGVNFTSYSSAAKAVRNELAGFMNSEGMKAGVGFSMLERQLEKAAIVVGYVAAYMLARNIIRRDIGRGAASAALLILACVFCLAMGSRGTMMYYGIALAACLFICFVRSGRRPRTLALGFLVIGICACLLAGAFFYFSGSLIGREPGSGVVEYLSFYYGCGVPALQYALDSGALPWVDPGIRTFYYLFSVPFKLGLIDSYPSYSIMWVDMGGHGCNIFTGFARYYLDFGLAGVVVLSALSGLLMTLVFDRAQTYGHPLFVVFAGYLAAYAFDFAREEFIFSRLLSPTQFVSVAIMLAITLFLTTSLREDMKRAKAFFSRKRLA